MQSTRSPSREWRAFSCFRGVVHQPLPRVLGRLGQLGADADEPEVTGACGSSESGERDLNSNVIALPAQ
jgi:hypothetical protein